MVNLNCITSFLLYLNQFTIPIERDEQERKEKARKDKEDASNGKLFIDTFKDKIHSLYYYSRT